MLKTNDQRKPGDEVELSILCFCQVFRANILTDSKVVATALGNEDDIPNYSSGYYKAISDNLKQSDFLDIMEIFFNKIILNLMYNTSSTAVLKLTLDLMHNLVRNSSTAKMLMKLDSVQDLVANHASKYDILTDLNVLKYLCRFYRTLALLWSLD